jgi:hypothetical protein
MDDHIELMPIGQQLRATVGGNGSNSMELHDGEHISLTSGSGSGRGRDSRTASNADLGLTSDDNGRHTKRLHTSSISIAILCMLSLLLVIEFTKIAIVAHVYTEYSANITSLVGNISVLYTEAMNAFEIIKTDYPLIIGYIASIPEFISTTEVGMNNIQTFIGDSASFINRTDTSLTQIAKSLNQQGLPRPYSG